MARKNTIDLSNSSMLAVELTRMALEVHFGLQVRLTHLEIGLNLIRGEAPPYHRTISLFGQAALRADSDEARKTMERDFPRKWTAFRTEIKLASSGFSDTDTWAPDHKTKTNIVVKPVDRDAVTIVAWWHHCSPGGYEARTNSPEGIRTSKIDGWGGWSYVARAKRSETSMAA